MSNSPFNPILLLYKSKLGRHQNDFLSVCSQLCQASIPEIDIQSVLCSPLQKENSAQASLLVVISASMEV